MEEPIQNLNSNDLIINLSHFKKKKLVPSLINLTIQSLKKNYKKYKNFSILPPQIRLIKRKKKVSIFNLYK